MSLKTIVSTSRAVLLILISLNISRAVAMNHSINATCPPWLATTATGQCTCGRLNVRSDCTIDRVQKVRCDPKNGMVTVCDGYLMTTSLEQDIPVVNQCSGYPNNDQCMMNITIQRSISNLSYLNDLACSKLNRKGTFCGSCKEGYGFAIFYQSTMCVDCATTQKWGAMYLLLQFLCVAIFYFMSVLLKLEVISSPLCALVFFWQAVSYSLTHASNFFELLGHLGNQSLLSTLVTVYGIWNLEFFRYVIPPVCLSASLSSIHVLLLDYLIAFYPLAITLVSYACIVMYDRQFKIMLYLWKPFVFCIGLLGKDWNPKKSILATFASFMILSYTKLLITSISLLTTTLSYSIMNGSLIQESLLLSSDPSIKALSLAHIPYIILSLTVLIIFILPPPLFLLLYPTKFFQKFLRCVRIRWHGLQFLVDTFQGWFKDGTNGTRDYRSVSAIYFLLRIALAVVIMITPVVKADNHSQQNLLFVIPGFLFLGTGQFFLVARPYKKNWMNISDGLVISLFGTIAFTFANYTANSTFLISVSIVLLPTILYSVYILYRGAKRFGLFTRLSNFASNVRACCRKRYVEDPAVDQAYDTDSDPFVIGSYRRTGSSVNESYEGGQEMVNTIEREAISQQFNSYGLQ